MDRVHQRTVPAHGAALPTTGARSVFDMAKETKQRKPRAAPPPLDADKVKIEKGVPIPEARVKRGGHYDALLSRLTVNSSAALPIAHEKSLRSAAGGWQKKHAGTKFVVRVVSQTDVRVWRTA